ncbi:MAG: hypothetical protein EOP06_31345, partial [Proteobacteria bacterium]
MDNAEEKKRTRKTRPYPASSFQDALPLAEAIMKYASGEKVRRLTLLQQMNKSPTSGATKMMITNSGKYDLTTGSYSAEYLELTPDGKITVDEKSGERLKREASFKLAVLGVEPFKILYEHYKDKRLPEREVMKDVLRDSEVEVPDLDECVDTFTVNVKYLELLRTIGGAETLVSIDLVLDELGSNKSGATSAILPIGNTFSDRKSDVLSTDWDTVCFYITPIGDEDSLQRKHSDLFIASLVQPALDELGLRVVRADMIGDPGMITTQVFEYLKKSKLAIADLSYLNPNVFY